MKDAYDFFAGQRGAVADTKGKTRIRRDHTRMTLMTEAPAGPLHHGGRLREAAARYGIPLEQWLDLSTGINPQGWPVPAVPAAAWSRLPEDEDGLEAAARAYYDADHLLPVAGSQAAILALPRLRPPSRVRILSPTYAEHSAAWQSAGHEVTAVTAAGLVRTGTLAPSPIVGHSSAARFAGLVRTGALAHSPQAGEGWGEGDGSGSPTATLGDGTAMPGGDTVQDFADDALTACDVLVVINPNNPTGVRFSPERLLDWHDRLAARGGWLVVDEAFMDVTPEDSLCPFTARPGLIVLRSLGKFFGLAGARLGFVAAHPTLLAALRHRLGPWTVNAPTRWAARLALTDGDWQAQARPRLTAAGERLRDLLTRHDLTPAGGCALFQWVLTPTAPRLQQDLARQGILTRLFHQPASLHPGLTGGYGDWASLHPALPEREADGIPLGPGLTGHEADGASLRLNLPGREVDWTSPPMDLAGREVDWTSLRLGLPGSEADWARLERALADLARPAAESRP